MSDPILPEEIGRPAMVEKVLQFHPEASGEPGLTVLRNFVQLCSGSQHRHRSDATPAV